MSETAKRNKKRPLQSDWVRPLNIVWIAFVQTLAIGCADQAPRTATIATEATVDPIEPSHVIIKANKPELKPGEQFVFTARPADPVNTLVRRTYLWKFTDLDGNKVGKRPSTRARVKIKFDEPGYYLVHLAVDLDTSTQQQGSSREVTAQYKIAVLGPGVPGLNPARVQIEHYMGNETAEIPVNVAFGYRSSVALKPNSFQWRFGDGALDTVPTPNRTYERYGRFQVQLDYEDEFGRQGTARTYVTLRPSKIDLPGLADIKRFAIYSPGLQSVDRAEFNEQRYKDLAAMNVDTILPGIPIRKSFWRSAQEGGDRARNGTVKRLDQAKRHGIGVGLIIAGKHDWFTNDTGDNAKKKERWQFKKHDGEAETKLAAVAAQAEKNPAWDIASHEAVQWILLGHEIGEYANHSQRKDIYSLTSKYFGHTPLVPYYGGVAVSFERGNEANQLGPDEGDVVFVSIAGPRSTDEDGNTVPDALRTRAELQRQRTHILREVPEKRLWINTNLPGENPDDTEEDMWSANDILDFARVILNAGGVELLSFRSLGRFQYDLGYGMNTNNPNRPETGFVNQRLAVKTIGAWVKQAKAGLPIPNDSLTRNRESYQWQYS